ncbi:MAG: type VI secretion system-associated protein TagF, partial [Mesorhizobium sp.]
MNAPGFYGKMPATGDFVTRRLAGDFVRVWDRWLAQHVVPLFGLETWPADIALRFVAGPAVFGAAAGIIVQSADRVGRQFPLSVVARLAGAPLKLAYSDAWFD